MKNKLYILISSSFLLTAMSSCNGYLDETPYSFVAPENFFESATDAELALTGLYDILNTPNVQGQGNHHLWGRGMHYLTAIGNDELVANNTAPEIDYIAYSNYTYHPGTETGTYVWIFLYAGINRANYILERVPNIEMDEGRKNEILAEAHFLRGLFYFYTGFFWGGVPIVTTTEVVEKTGRNTLEEVMAQSKNDLQFAYDHLQERNMKSGRANKYSAAGMLAKLYLYLGTSKKNNVGSAFSNELNNFDWVNVEECLTKASQLCQEIYDQSDYRLIDNYAYLFLAATEEEARNEHIFLVQAGPGGSNEHILSAYLSGPTGNVVTNGGTYGRLRPLIELYNKYDAADGRMTNNMVGSIQTTTQFVMINNIPYFVPAALNTNTFANYNLGKYREADPENKTSRGIPNWAGETDFGIIRFGDIVLMLAELKFYEGNELGARELIREIRARASEYDNNRLEQITQAYYKIDFIEELLDERSRELCAEGWRRFDLIRLNKLGETVRGLQTTTAVMNIQNVPEIKANYEDFKIWYPIPRREIELNPLLTQNFGYTN